MSRLEKQRVPDVLALEPPRLIDLYEIDSGNVGCGLIYIVYVLIVVSAIMVTVSDSWYKAASHKRQQIETVTGASAR